MAITTEFKKAVLEQDKISVRIMLKDILLIDPTLKKFDEMILYAENHIVDLYDVHDGEVLNLNPDSWTEDYFIEQKVNVVTNFSKERIELLKKIVTRLYATEYHTKSQKKDDFRNTKINNIHRKQQRESNRRLGLGLTVAGGVVAVTGVCLSKFVLTVAGGVVAAVGISMVVRDRKD